ncbi:RsbRD N-terminal domain-containing protein [Streptomyces collinus]
MSEQPAAESAARGLGVFLESRREQIGQRWADTDLFRTVFTVSRDEAAEACKTVVDAPADVAWSGRLEDIAAPGFDAARERLGRMAASRSHRGSTPAQIAHEAAGLRVPAVEPLRAEPPGHGGPEARDVLLAQTLLMGTLRLVILETTVDAGERLIARQRRHAFALDRGGAVVAPRTAGVTAR